VTEQDATSALIFIWYMENQWADTSPASLEDVESMLIATVQNDAPVDYAETVQDFIDELKEGFKVIYYNKKEKKIGERTLYVDAKVQCLIVGKVKNQDFDLVVSVYDMQQVFTHGHTKLVLQSGDNGYAILELKSKTDTARDIFCRQMFHFLVDAQDQYEKTKGKLMPVGPFRQ